MTLDNDIDTSINLRSDYRDSSINDSVFFSSSISIDVICLVAVMIVLLLTIAFFLWLSKRIIVCRVESSLKKANVRRLKRQNKLFAGTYQENF